MSYQEIMKRDFRDKLDLYVCNQILDTWDISTITPDGFYDWIQDFEDNLKKEFKEPEGLLECYYQNILQMDSEDTLDRGSTDHIRSMKIKDLDSLWYQWERVEEKYVGPGDDDNKKSPSFHLQFNRFFTKFKGYFKSILNLDTYNEIVKGSTCHYCGVSQQQVLALRERNLIRTKRKRGFVMEIDQKEPNLGYQKDNLVLSCYWCNNAKTDEFDYQEFIPISRGINLNWIKRLDQITDDPKVQQHVEWPWVLAEGEYYWIHKYSKI